MTTAISTEDRIWAHPNDPRAHWMTLEEVEAMSDEYTWTDADGVEWGGLLTGDGWMAIREDADDLWALHGDV